MQKTLDAIFKFITHNHVMWFFFMLILYPTLVIYLFVVEMFGGLWYGVLDGLCNFKKQFNWPKYTKEEFKKIRKKYWS